jgi:hypothetical protein
MMKRTGMTVAAAALAILFGSSGVATAQLDKCQKNIQKNVGKAQAKIVKGLSKCLDTKAKNDAKGTPCADSAAACQKELDKINPLISDTIATLNGDSACSDENLIDLGHLPKGSFGDRFGRALMASAVRNSYYQLLDMVEGAAGEFQDMAECGGCAGCATYASPPCARHACVLTTDGSTGAVVNLQGGGTISVPLSPAVVYEICNIPSISGDLIVLGGPDRSLDVAVVAAGSIEVCVTNMRTEGMINCTGAAGMPSVNYTACIDHTGDGTDDSECTETLCTSAADDFAHGEPAQTGGTCVQYTTSAGSVGRVFALFTNQLTIVDPSAGEDGADGVLCTPDDTATPGAPAQIALTTGMTESEVLDANNGEGATITASLTGAPYADCDPIKASNLAGVSLVGSFPVVHSLCLAGNCDDSSTEEVEGPNQEADQVTIFGLSCQ